MNINHLSPLPPTIPPPHRIQSIDALKGFAIFCVLYGHALQYLRGDYDFFHNPMFEIIYSFHMALFFMISGFFFRSSLKLNLKDFLCKKGIQLLLPCMAWAIIECLIRVTFLILSGKYQLINNWFEELKPYAFPVGWPWFLKELFISYLIVYVSLKLLRKEWIACLTSILVVLIVPCWEIQRVFLPVFWAGIYLKNHYSLLSKHAKPALIVSGVLFILCLLFWDGNYTMYVTNFQIVFELKTQSFDFSNMDITLFRLFIGLCGSLFWFMLFQRIYKSNRFFSSISKIGVNTMAIYLIQSPLWERIGRVIYFSEANIWIYTLIITPLASLAILAISLLIIKVVQKNKYAELLLFGKQ